MQFTNVAAGRIKQPGGPRVGTSALKGKYNSGGYCTGIMDLFTLRLVRMQKKNSFENQRRFN
jgi:hypothetical protein